MDGKPKTGISFGLSATSKRPGANTPTGGVVKKGLFHTPGKTKEVIKPVESHNVSPSLPISLKLSIPLPPENEALHTSQEQEEQESWQPIDPNKFGLQTRRSTEQKSDKSVNHARFFPFLNPGWRFEKETLDPASTQQQQPQQQIPPADFAKAYLKALGWKETSPPTHFDQLKSLPRGVGLGANPQTANGRKTFAEIAEDEAEGMLSIEDIEHELQLERELAHTAGNKPSPGNEMPHFQKTFTLPGVGSLVRIRAGVLSGKVGEVISLVGDLVTVHVDTREGEIVSVDVADLETLPSQTVKPLATDALWMMPGAKVCLAKSPKAMGTIVDVIREGDGNLTSIITLDDDGRMMEAITQSQLVPMRPEVGHKALVVSGEHHGQIVVVEELIGGKNCLVQLMGDSATTSEFLSLSLDDLVKYE